MIYACTCKTGESDYTTIHIQTSKPLYQLTPERVTNCLRFCPGLSENIQCVDIRQIGKNDTNPTVINMALYRILVILQPTKMGGMYLFRMSLDTQDDVRSNISILAENKLRRLAKQYAKEQKLAKANLQYFLKNVSNDYLNKHGVYRETDVSTKIDCILKTNNANIVTFQTALIRVENHDGSTKSLYSVTLPSHIESKDDLRQFLMQTRLRLYKKHQRQENMEPMYADKILRQLTVIGWENSMGISASAKSPATVFELSDQTRLLTVKDEANPEANPAENDDSDMIVIPAPARLVCVLSNLSEPHNIQLFQMQLPHATDFEAKSRLMAVAQDFIRNHNEDQLCNWSFMNRASDKELAQYGITRTTQLTKQPDVVLEISNTYENLVVSHTLIIILKSTTPGAPDEAYYVTVPNIVDTPEKLDKYLSERAGLWPGSYRDALKRLCGEEYAHRALHAKQIDAARYFNFENEERI